MFLTTSKPKKFKRKGKYVVRKSAKYLKIVAIFMLLILTFAIFYLLLNKHELVNIKHIQITGTKTFVSAVDVEELVNTQALGQNIILLKSAKLEANLLEIFQGAKDIKVAKRFPTTLKVEVFERVPFALLYNDKDVELYMIDKDGYVLGIAEKGKSNLPNFFYNGNIRVGYFIDKELVSIYLELISALDDEKVSVSSISVEQRYLRVYVYDGVEVLVGKEKNTKESVSVLTRLLKQLFAEGKRVKKVDLRYDKVIVSY